MCFTIPKKILETDGKSAVIEGGSRVDVAHMECVVGDYVIVTSNIAIEKVERDDAEQMRLLIKKTNLSR